jgi:hypothetical protein
MVVDGLEKSLGFFAGGNDGPKAKRAKQSEAS